MESPEHEKRSITEYVEIEARPATVEHLEKVASERVRDTRYDVWDVHTDEDRYWVVTPPTNLYEQSDFKSMDVVLSFHIGFTMRVFARAWRAIDDVENEGTFALSRRLLGQAEDRLDEGEEAHDFQAVGMRCREGLVAFLTEARDEFKVDAPAEELKAADFVGWTDYIANTVARGERHEALRGYIKKVARERGRTSTGSLTRKTREERTRRSASTER